MPTQKERLAPLDALIGKNVLERRQTRAMSRARLAALLGVSMQSIQKYESGQTRISAALLIEIAALLDCYVEELLGNAIWQIPEADDLSGREIGELMRSYAKLGDEQRAEIRRLAKRLVKWMN
jgi:transcriptional regulator with XRE-family HTH domain